MVVNIFAFKGGTEKNLVVRTEKPLKIDLTSEETLTILDDSTKAWIDVVPSNILYISSGDEEVMKANLEEIRRKAEAQALKNKRAPKKNGKPKNVTIS
ncbi:MAG: hypothetical protein PHC95_05085 [Parabacteroides sp.]|nr:hypothetical protein [Parabacteroides sp.]